MALTLVIPPGRCADPVPRRDFQVSARLLPFTFRMLVQECEGATATVIVREGEVLLGNLTLVQWRDQAIVRRQE
jgi:hypothetical protein